MRGDEAIRHPKVRSLVGLSHPRAQADTESGVSWLLWHAGCVSCPSRRERWDHHGLESHMLPISQLVFPMAKIGKPDCPEAGGKKSC